MNRKSKRTAFICTINAFIVTFDHLNASLMNKSINVFKENNILLLLTPNF